jgi:O-antigen/teichoic acid export membrane protein
VTEAGGPPELGGEPGGLQRRVARGLTWTVIHTWGGQALSLVVFVILARLLSPADFGLVALAAVFVALAQLIVDQGLGDALVQRREVTRSHIDTAFWVAMATGALLTVAAYLLAAPIGAAVNQPELVPVLQVLSVTFVLSALTSIPIALLTRQLAFRLLAIRAILAIVVGGVVGIALALGGAGVWALVGQQVAAAVLSVLMLWAVTDWRPRFHASRAEFGELFGFGIRVVGSDILGFISRNADNFLIGVFLGTIPLGIYAVGYRILDTSQRLLVNVARKITFPAFSRLQHDPGRMRLAYLRAMRAASVLILPGYVGLALVAPELVRTLFGTRWSEAGPVAAILFVGGPVLGLQAFSGSLLYAAGRPDVVLRFRVITTIANVLGFAAAVSLGIAAVAVAFTARGYLLLPLLLVWTRRATGVTAGDHARALRGTAITTAVMAAVILLLKLAIGDRLAPAALLAIEVAVGGLTVMVTLWLVERSLLEDLVTVAGHAVPGIGRFLSNRRASATPGDPPAVSGGRG